MSRNGSGTYNLPAGNPVVTGTTISSTWANNTMNDLAAALTGSVAADGQTPMTGNLNANNNKIVNVTDPTQAQDAATKTYVDAKTDGTSAGAFTTLSASGVATFSAGTVSAPAITTSGDTNTGIFFPAADTIAFTEGGVEAMRIDSNGFVGINAVPTNERLLVDGDVVFKYNFGSVPASYDAGELLSLQNSGSLYIDKRVISFGASPTSTGSSFEASSGYVRSTGQLSLVTGATERVRVGTDGSVGIGLTDDNAATMDDKAGFFLNDDGNIIISHKDANATGYYASFVYDGVVRGAIQGSSGGAAVAYNSFSDHRLKENVAPMTGALDKVARLKPVTYKWKSNGLDADGFIAHELQEVCPQAVSGEKDAVDEDGKPIYQGVDTSFLVATLTAAIQEQQAIINDLKARIETLEAK